ncbi:MAG: hypothetical protein ACRDGM_18620 [bacterium]
MKRNAATGKGNRLPLGRRISDDVWTSFLNVVLPLEPSYQVPKRLRRHPGYEGARRLGLRGIVATSLRGPVTERLWSRSPRARQWAAGVFCLVEGVSPLTEPPRPGTMRVPWRAVYDRLATLPGVDRIALRLQCEIFERLRFQAVWCRHGDHVFLTDDRRMRVCLKHRLAERAAQKRRKRAEYLRGQLIAALADPHGMPLIEVLRRFKRAGIRIAAELETEGIASRRIVGGQERLFKVDFAPG